MKIKTPIKTNGAPTIVPSTSIEIKEIKLEEIQGVEAEPKRTFIKHSEAYPGHDYTFRFKEAIKGEDGAESLVEIYECSNCIEVVSKYECK